MGKWKHCLVAANFQKLIFRKHYHFKRELKIVQGKDIAYREITMKLRAVVSTATMKDQHSRLKLSKYWVKITSNQEFCSVFKDR